MFAKVVKPIVLATYVLGMLLTLLVSATLFLRVFKNIYFSNLVFGNVVKPIVLVTLLLNML